MRGILVIAAAGLLMSDDQLLGALAPDSGNSPPGELRGIID